MRRKAENRIRRAAEEIAAASDAPADTDMRYPLDEIRSRSGLFPKVFDKTILDMARLETIRLLTEELHFFTPAEIRGMVRSEETVFTSFYFSDGTRFPTAFEITRNGEGPPDDSTTEAAEGRPPEPVSPDSSDSPVAPIPPADFSSSNAPESAEFENQSSDAENSFSDGAINFPFPEDSDGEEGEAAKADVPEPVILILQGLQLSEWETFERYCHKEAGLFGAEMIERMIREVLKKS